MTTQGHAKRFYYGTAAERAALDIGTDAVGTLFWETDTNRVYLWSGTAWHLGGLDGLTGVEIDQLENIGATTISEAQWGYLGAMAGAAATALTGLSDTPGALGTVGQLLAMNAGEDAVEWVAAGGGDGTTDVLMVQVFS